MRSKSGKTALRCAVYTRVSTEHGLEQQFNSLDNQREASEAYVKSQAHEGWKLIRTHYDDGGYSGGSMDRPALQRLLDDVRARRIDVVVVYKVDRLTRSLADFAKLVELFDAHQVSFVSVTQAFNTTTSIGRLTLNVLLSFAQFEREVTGERIRDKIAASKKKGMWMGGVVPLGYRVEDRALHIVEDRAEIVRSPFRRYLEAGSVVRLKQPRVLGYAHGVRGRVLIARPKHADTRYLELKNGKFRVAVAVPRALHGKLGTKLKRPLNTDSRATANTHKCAVVTELKAIIDRAGRGVPQGDHLTREALELATHRVTVRDNQELAQLEEIVPRADE